MGDRSHCALGREHAGATRHVQLVLSESGTSQGRWLLKLQVCVAALIYRQKQRVCEGPRRQRKCCQLRVWKFPCSDDVGTDPEGGCLRFGQGGVGQPEFHCGTHTFPFTSF